MITFFALIIAIILQFVGAIVALGLTKQTKYSLSWILISVGFLVMAIQRFIEFIPFVWRNWEKDVVAINTWLGIITSVLITGGVILIREIFNFLKKAERSRDESEKRILNAIIQTEEKERRRFAKDLHDGLGPLLSAVKMAVSSLTQIDQEKKNNEIIENADLSITEAIRSLKEISNNLSPHVLDNFGLASSIKSFSGKINSAKSVNISFNTNMAEERLDYNTEVVLYRVFCELINNTIKHAQAKNIEIELIRHNKLLTFVYRDDGIGFDVNEVLGGKAEGMGYSNILSRIKSIKGMISVESDKNKGTKAIIIVNI
jgi:signal transduction histidine kinase